jgi:hypothetical protein
VVKGASSDIHPLPRALYAKEAKDLGIAWDHNPQNYWSSQITMWHWLSDFVVKHFACKKKELGYSPDQVCIVFLDIWSIHCSRKFCHWVKKTNPWIWLI